MPIELTLPRGETNGGFADFRGRKAAILEQLEPVRRIAAERDDARAADSLEGIANKLAANRFHLAVLGQFKRGKTTLINSLLGADVLPVAVVPLTSIITLLSYGQMPEVWVHFLSGESKQILIEELADYVTEPGNPANKRAVKHVAVRYPSAYLRDGVILADTPGVGSTYQHNTEVTHAFLAHVDAAIVLVSVDPPLTQVEAEFLRRARDEVHRFFFVLNKIDQMTEEEMRESLAFTAARIEEQLSMPQIQVFPLSARRALEAKKGGDKAGLKASGLPAFERELQKFLMTDKGLVLLASALADTLRVAGALRFALELERKALTVPLQELERKQATLAREFERIEQERRDMNVLLKNEVLQLLARVEADLKRHVERSTPAVLKRLDEFHAQHSGASRTGIGPLLDDFMMRQVEAVFNEWRKTEERAIGAAFAEMSGRFTDKTNRIIRDIQTLASGLFDLNVEVFDSPESLRAETQVYYMTDSLFAFALDKAPFVLPGFLFRRHVLNKMRERVHLELDRNSGRIRYDYLQRIEKSTEEFRRALNRKIDATLDGIRRALESAAARKHGSQADYEASSRVFARQGEQLGAIIEACRALAAEVAEAEEKNGS